MWSDSARVARSTVWTALPLVMMSTFSPRQPLAMELKIVGNQIILSGPVVGDEPDKVKEALASSPGIDTVILRNSPGGNALAGYQVGQLLPRARFTDGGVGLLLFLMLADVSRRCYSLFHR